MMQQIEAITALRSAAPSTTILFFCIFATPAPKREGVPTPLIFHNPQSGHIDQSGTEATRAATVKAPINSFFFVFVINPPDAISINMVL
jgi:hypothetical protein